MTIYYLTDRDFLRKTIIHAFQLLYLRYVQDMCKKLSQGYYKGQIFWTSGSGRSSILSSHFPKRLICLRVYGLNVAACCHKKIWPFNFIK